MTKAFISGLESHLVTHSDVLDDSGWSGLQFDLAPDVEFAYISPLAQNDAATPGAPSAETQASAVQPPAPSNSSNATMVAVAATASDLLPATSSGSDVQSVPQAATAAAQTAAAASVPASATPLDRDVQFVTAAAAAPAQTSTPDTVIVTLSEDACQGDAQFTISIDGQQVGGVQTVTASNAFGQSQAFSFSGDFGTGEPVVAIDFLNAVVGATAAAQRSLYLQNIEFDATNYTIPTPFHHDETQSFALTAAGTAVQAGTTSQPSGAATAGGADTLVLYLAEDAYQGNAQFVVSVNGTQLAGPQQVTALYNSGDSEAFTFTGNFGSNPQIDVSFINDAAGADGDRNLFLNSVVYDGQTYQTGTVFYQDWTRLITLDGATATVGDPSNYTPPATGAGSGSGSSGSGSSGTGGSGSVGSLPTVIATPMMAAPTAAGDVVGFQLQNTGTAPLAAREITFGETFASGLVPAGSQLIATINGQQVAVQMDVKTYNPDGSVRMAVLTLEQPQIAAGATLDGMFSLAPAGTQSGTPINIAALTAPGAYKFTVALVMHNADGTTTNYNFDAATLLAQALANGTNSVWLQGSQVTQVRVDTPVTGSMHLTFDISLYADGNICTDVGFDNDLAMQASGGAVTYDATVTQNGQTIFQQSDINQDQYNDWDQQFWNNGAPSVNVVQDATALEQAGAVQNYDTSTGVASSLVATEASNMATGTTYGVLGSGNVTLYMPTTGGRPDVGAEPQWNVVWLLTGNQTAAQYALAQANVAGSVPWNFADPTAGSGNYITVLEDPTLWDDARGGTPNGGGSTGLTQPVDPNSAWTPDTSHQPDLSYFAYLQTGDRTYLDQLNAQASFDELATWPDQRDNAQGLVVNGQQERAMAWCLREVVEAANANPVGSPMKAYFTQMAENNIQYMLNFAQNSGEGQLAGWMPGIYGSTTGTYMAPWQQDFLASTVALAAEMGIPGAKQVLQWETNFLAGRFLNGANGFNPFDGANYTLLMGNAAGTPYTTWAQAGAANEAAGLSGNGTWSASNVAYLQGAEVSLADIITVTGSTEAIQAYGWLQANAQGATIAASQDDPTFSIVPRLADGNELTSNHVVISNDNTATTLSGSNSDQLLYETGSGNVTVQGGAGINMLFAGSGNDTLIGGPGQDYMFGGSGSDTFEGGAGSNFMQAGSGSDIFVLSEADVAGDIIAGFKPGVDHLQIAGAASGSSAAQGFLAGAVADASGNAMLHLSANHTVTLQGIGVSQLNMSIFG
jgi:hypothetical protein